MATRTARKLLPETEIVTHLLSVSAVKKKTQARKLLKEYAQEHGLGDPETVGPESSKLVINLLFKYSGLEDFQSCNIQSDELKGRDAVAGIITALRNFYRDEGFLSPWKLSGGSDGSLIASGNPLEGNVSVKESRKMRSKKLSSLGNVVRTAPLLTAEHIIENGKEDLLGKEALKREDICLHAFMLKSMNCGMPYDEISKIRMEDVKVSKYGVEFGISEKCKNSNSYRHCILRRWPGELFSKCILMDPLYAMSSWIYTRGGLDGYLFCNIAGKSERLVLQDPWPRPLFVKFMQPRFKEIGFPTSGKTWSAHSGKRGGVQILRFLECKDLFILNWIGMRGQNAYIRYTEGFNDLFRKQVPDFATSSDAIAHAHARSELDKLLDSEEFNEVQEWLSDFEEN